MNEQVIDPYLASLVPSVRVSTVEVGNDTVVVDVLNAWAYALDPVASFVWTSLTDGLTLDDIVEELVAAFDAPLDVIASDVSNLVLELGKLGVMTDAEWAAEPPLDPTDDVGSADEDDEADDACVPEPATFDDRYLAAPPNH